MIFSRFVREYLSRILFQLTTILLLVPAASIYAASVSGVVTDTSGASVVGANITLYLNGKPIGNDVTKRDGSYQITTGGDGRFFVVVTTEGFRQLETPNFYAGKLDSVERNLVLEPAWVRESVIVTATGTPTPQSQTGATISVLGPNELERREDLVSSLRLMPGTAIVQSGQRGAVTSLFVRGGGSADSKILMDGVDAGDLGNVFDFGSLSTTAIESAEVYRGANSSLYGADAVSGVVNMTTPRGTTSFPSVIVTADAGNFNTSHEQAEVSGTLKRLDYLAAFNWLQTDNSIPRNPYHISTLAGNFGWQWSNSTQVRGTVHYGVDATGVPNAWDFYHVADDRTEKDQRLYLSTTIDNQTTASFHNVLRYGATHKREQNYTWQPSGELIEYDPYGDEAYFGNTVTIRGANGYTTTGRAALDYPGSYPQTNQLVSNRDQLIYQGDYRFTPHLTALIGFHYENERGSEPGTARSMYYAPVERNNYDYIAAVNGDFKRRLFYSLGGSLQHYSLFGTQTSPRASVSYYVVRPRSRALSGTRVLFNFGDSLREPSLTEQVYSLYGFLSGSGGQTTIQQLHISPLAAPAMRMYEGGLEQAFLQQRIVFRASYFHNQFGRQIEYVDANLVPKLIPGLSPVEQNQLLQVLTANGAYELAVNSEAYRAQGIESTIEGGIGHSIFLRGGYTYLDAVVQRSFANDTASTFVPTPTFQGIPIGVDSPLQGARPFRRPPHTAFGTASYSERKFTVLFTAAYASRSDDSTFLAYSDQYGGNSLLLPNRNLDFSFVKMDLGASYQLLSWLGVYAQTQNLTSNHHIAPIGYESLPFSFTTGLKLLWGPGSKKQ